jgi:hypothetical protein
MNKMIVTVFNNESSAYKGVNALLNNFTRRVA